MKIAVKKYSAYTMALISIIFVAVGVNKSLPIEFLVQRKYLVLILLPAICAVTFRSLKDLTSWPLTLQRIGIPLGIFCSSVFSYEFFTNMSDPDDVLSSIANAMLAVLYGGAITALGIAHGAKNQEVTGNEEDTTRVWSSILVASVFLTLVALVALFEGEYWYFLQVEALLLLGGVLGLTFAFQNFKPKLDGVLNAIVITMLGVTFLTLCGWLLGEGDPVKTGRTVSIGLSGFCLSSALLSAVAICGPTDQSNNRALERTNWHVLEVYSLFFLVILAPPSLIEIISE